MELVVIADEDSVVLFNLLGITGYIRDVNDTDFEDLINSLINDQNIGIIIISERLSIKHKKFLLHVKRFHKYPLVMSIPHITDVPIYI